MSITEAPPRQRWPIGVAGSDVPLSRMHHELQCAAREAVGDAVTEPSSGAITALIVALDELLRFEAGLIARGDPALATELVARHDHLLAACREPVHAPRNTWDLTEWALGLRHLLLAHIDASSGMHRRV